MVAAEGLSLERGGRELFRDLSIAVRQGQLWQIEGENGAGKTSLLRILSGLSRFGYAGKVTRTSAVLYIGHQPAVKSLLSPRENLAWHVSGDASYPRNEIDDALARVGLNGYEGVPTYTLSAGQQRRVNLARLFISQVPLWLLDEPFTAIDRRGVVNLQSRLSSHIEGGGAVVVTSHQPLEVACDICRVDLTGSPRF
ncbi:MAG: cytochrome c biogenesis heme-transporting ATPase CcmA [Halioglobus sp.]|nr:cytochrome c biogenesis heme-transporting ATPase CcmA [Halioglobus sp.]